MKPDEFNFRLEDAYDRLDARNADLYERDKAYPLSDLDHEWPKLQATGGRCGCPKHHEATDDLFYACYVRILEAKGGVAPRPAREIARKLAGILR